MAHWLFHCKIISSFRDAPEQLGLYLANLLFPSRCNLYHKHVIDLFAALPWSLRKGYSVREALRHTKASPRPPFTGRGRHVPIRSWKTRSRDSNVCLGYSGSIRNNYVAVCRFMRLWSNRTQDEAAKLFESRIFSCLTYLLTPYPPGNTSTSYSKARQTRNWLSKSNDYFDHV
jgi:hypothetical protein